MRIKIVLLTGFLLFWITGTTMGQQSRLTGFSYVAVETNPRAAALAGAADALTAPDAAALFINPALLNDAHHRSIAASYVNLPYDLNAGAVSWAYDVPAIGTLGAGVRYLSWGDVEGGDLEGNPTGTFNASDLTVTVGAGRNLSSRLRAGVNLNLLHSRVDVYGGTAVAADLALLYSLGDRSAVSVQVRHAGTVLNEIGTGDETLSPDVRIGFAHRLEHLPLLISVVATDLAHPERSPDDAALPARIFHFIQAGGEIRLAEALRVRIGYNTRLHRELSTVGQFDTAGLTLGMGLTVSRFQVSYAWESWSDYGKVHYFGLATRL